MERSLTGDEPKPEKTIKALFREAFPQYLALGMSYKEFWEGESWLVKAYREARKIKNDEINSSAWLNGVYVLNALQSGVPVILNGIVKEHVSLPSFPEKPIDLTGGDHEKQEQKQMELQKARMKEIAERFNAAFKKKKDAENQK